jgi:hypothetical protein
MIKNNLKYDFLLFIGIFHKENSFYALKNNNQYRLLQS